MSSDAKRSAAAILGAGVLMLASSVWAGSCGVEVVPGSEVDIDGFDRPESAYWDSGSRAFYISNIGNPGGADPAGTADGNGYLSKLVPGEPHVRYWVEGLNSPKGIRSHGGKLYVADIKDIVVVDIATGVVERRITVPDANVLNDPMVHDNDLYVSDFRRLTVWRIRLKGSPDPQVLIGPAVLGSYGQPNGVYARGRRLWVGTIPNATPPAAGGYLLEFDRVTGALLSAHGNGTLGRIDGLEGNGPNFLVTDNGGVAAPSRLLGYDPRKGVTTVISTSTPRGGIFTRFADIGLRPDDCMLVIPHLESPISSTSMTNFVTIVKLAPAE